MTFTLRPVEPDTDAPLLHAWVTEERGVFWGMGDHSVREVRDVYAFLDSLDTHHAYLVHEAGAPVAIFQTYEPQHDPVGEVYDVWPGDLGVHLFVGPGEPRSGFTTRLATFLFDVVLADPAVRRVVVEPDVRNERSLRLFARLGFEAGPVVDLGHKTAQLAFIEPGATPGD